MAMKGQWKTVEAILAGVVILMFLAVLSTTYVQVPADIPENGYKALDAVYEKGLLRTYAAQGDTASINSEIAATGYLTAFNHTVSICDYSGSCTGSAPSGDNVWVSSMILSGDDSYEPMEVIVYVFR